MQYKNLTLSFLLLIGIQFVSFGQRAEIGVNAGGAGYIGDLNQYNPLKISGMNAGIFGKVNFDPHWGLGLHFNYGEIKANDASSKNADLRDRNLNFRTSLNEIAFIGSFNFMDIYSPASRKRITPYLFAGAGGVIFSSSASYPGSTITDLRAMKSEGQPAEYRNYAIVIPYGAGVKYKKSENWTLFGQIGYRSTFTYYLDDVKGVYNDTTDPALPGSGPRYFPPYNASLTPSTKVLGTQRGTSGKYDTYLFVNIGISYTFVSQKCFTF